MCSTMSTSPWRSLKIKFVHGVVVDPIWLIWNGWSDFGWKKVEVESTPLGTSATLKPRVPADLVIPMPALHVSGIKASMAALTCNLMSEVVGPMTQELDIKRDPSSGNYWWWFEMFNGAFFLFFMFWLVLFQCLTSFFGKLDEPIVSMCFLSVPPTRFGVVLRRSFTFVQMKKSHVVVNLQFVWRNKASFHQAFHFMYIKWQYSPI